MWDNVALLRIITNTMLNFSLAAGLSGAGYYLLHLPNAFPIRSAQLSVAPQHVDAGQVLRVLRDSVQGNLLTVDLNQVRNNLEQLSWVRMVNIRREFPDSLRVMLEEHQALAHWNDTDLVNIQGEVFVSGDKTRAGETVDDHTAIFPDDDKYMQPRFFGPEGASSEMTNQYAIFSKKLTELNLRVEQLTLSPRHAWQMRLSNGMVLELGREDMQLRLTRFVTVYPYSLATQNLNDMARRPTGAVAYVDLRYRNGFAVRRGVSEKG